MNPDSAATSLRENTVEVSATAASPVALQRLASALVAAVAVPEVAGERCVHARIATARCRACVEACPRGAWIIDDEQVGIDTEACDGCGVCAPACPEGAIIGDRTRGPSLRLRRDRPAAFLACERVGVSTTVGVMPCLHAIGIGELLRLYRRGARDWIIGAAPCESCPRGTAPRFQEAIRQAQTLLASRDLPPLTLTVLEAQSWSACLDRAAPHEDPVTLSRRNFFRKALHVAVDAVAENVGPDAAAAPFAPATAWLPDTGSQPVQLYRPAIDPSRCNGCDACARLCPHRAIALESSSDGVRYRLDGRRCTGCGICRDVCDQNAASVLALQPQEAAAVALAEQRCPACGTTYHEPAARLSRDGRCRICARSRRTRLLFQTLD